MKFRFKMWVRRVLCPIRGHPLYPAVGGAVVFYGGIEVSDKIQLSCACHGQRVHVLLRRET